MHLFAVFFFLVQDFLSYLIFSFSPFGSRFSSYLLFSYSLFYFQVFFSYFFLILSFWFRIFLIFVFGCFCLVQDFFLIFFFFSCSLFFGVFPHICFFHILFLNIIFCGRVQDFPDIFLFGTVFLTVDLYNISL